MLQWGTVFCLLALNALNCSHSTQKDYPIQPVAFTEVKMTDQFWRGRMETNRAVTIRHVFDKIEETGRIDNFAIAGGLKEGEQQGIYPFDDSDVFKTIEEHRMRSWSILIRSWKPILTV